MTILEYDLVVVGSGVAGLTAAVSAAEQGTKVAIVERAPSEDAGGGTRYTEAFLRMKSIDEVADDFEAHFASNYGGNVDPSLLAVSVEDESRWPPHLKSLSVANPSIIAAFAEAAGPTLRWLESQGVRFDYLPTPFITTSTSRMAPAGGGYAILESLLGSADGLDVDIHYETTARRLVVDDSTGDVRGVVCSSAEGPLEFHGAVVLASGGFQGNAEMLTRYVGQKATYTRPVARGGYFNKGEGIQMALDIGAAPCGDYGLFHAEPIDPRAGVPCPAIFIFPYGILVNRNGERFVDEAPATVDATYESIARRILDQPGGIAYAVFDARLDQIPNRSKAVRSNLPPISGASLSELGKRLELPMGTLERTVSDYNAACTAGELDALAPDGAGTTGLAIPKSNWARPIDMPPFVAYPMMAANVFTFGGLKVNEDAQVLDRDGNPIGNLYAAGEVVGLYFGTYTGSTSVLKGAVFGRKAGLHASERATANS